MNSHTKITNEDLQKYIKEFADQIYRYVFISMKHNLYADDIVQETFIKLYHQLENGTRIDNIKAWLFTVAHRLMIDVLRREKSRQHLSSDFHSNFIEQTIPHENLTSYKHELEHVHLLLENNGITKPDDKQLMILYMVFDFSLHELSIKFNTKPNTLSVRLKRLRSKFINFYEQSHNTIEKPSIE